MFSIEIMIQEHRVIEIGLNCLSEMIVHIMTAQKIKFFDAENVVNFFKNYADKLHHCKEEGQLFKIVESRHVTEEIAYMKDLMGDHEKGRSCVKAMDASFRDAAHGDIDQMMMFARSGRDYIDLLRGHILKEDRMFFPLIENSFSENEKTTLEEACRNVIAVDVDPVSGKKYTEIVNELAMIYNVNIEDMEDFIG